MSSFEPLREWQGRPGFSPERPAGRRFEPDRHPASSELPEGAGAAREAAPTLTAEDAEARLRDAYERGRADGRDEAFDAERRRVLAALEEAAGEMAGLREAALTAQRREIVELSLEIARTLVGRPLADDADALAGRLGQALAHLDRTAPARLRLSPPDHALASSGSGSELVRTVQGRALALVADPDLAPGEFRLETGTGELDARREVLLADLRARLLETAGGEGS